MEDEDVVDVRRHDWNDRGGGVEHLRIVFIPSWIFPNKKVVPVTASSRAHPAAI